MRKNKGATAVQKATGWSYNKALRFVRKNTAIAVTLDHTGSRKTVGETLVMMAIAEKEVDEEYAYANGS